jgi:hypothetical protein
LIRSPFGGLFGNPSITMPTLGWGFTAQLLQHFWRQSVGVLVCHGVSWNDYWASSSSAKA